MTGSRSCIYDLQIWVKSVARQPHSWIPGSGETWQPAKWCGKKPGESWSFGLNPLGIQDVHLNLAFVIQHADPSQSHTNHPRQTRTPGDTWTTLNPSWQKKKWRCNRPMWNWREVWESASERGREHHKTSTYFFWVCLNMLVMNNRTTHQLCRDAWGSSGSRQWVCNCLALLDVDSNPGCWRGNYYLTLLTYFSTSAHRYMQAYMWLYVHVCTHMFMYVHTLHYIALQYITLLTYTLELCSCYTSSFFPSWKPPTRHAPHSNHIAEG